MRQYEAFLPLVSWNTVFPAGNLLKLIRFPILVRNASGRNLNFTWNGHSPPSPSLRRRGVWGGRQGGNRRGVWGGRQGGSRRGVWGGRQSQLWGMGQGPAGPWARGSELAESSLRRPESSDPCRHRLCFFMKRKTCHFKGKENRAMCCPVYFN